MTIVEALKAKGATGSTIAEAVTTLPSGGGGGGGVFLVHYTVEVDEQTERLTVTECDKTYAEIVEASATQYVVAYFTIEGTTVYLPISVIADGVISFRNYLIMIYMDGETKTCSLSLTEITHSSEGEMGTVEGTGTIAMTT